MSFRKVRLLYNRRSGPGHSRLEAVQRAVSRHWGAVADRAWYFPADAAESDAMVAAAVADGADCVLVCGGHKFAGGVHGQEWYADVLRPDAETGGGH